MRCVLHSPTGAARALRLFPGFDDFDESREALRCTKPGTGTVDAPRAFSLKLRQITADFGLKPTMYDEELEVLH